MGKRTSARPLGAPALPPLASRPTATHGRPLPRCAGAAVQPMDLESAITAQTKDVPADQVTELVLDTCKATKVVGLDKFVNLRSLTLNGLVYTRLPTKCLRDQATQQREDGRHLQTVVAGGC